ncbi:TIR domain protein [Helicobacter pylori]|uniref:toll/interleukin-1 receptor domain-containing protein n=1 Tax=Helicobacter pylori TaxID=210 RepID=UPI000FDD7019|nr:toll/interleukin-1 receptor domain-containing protein [Helicobacter pylori]RVZ57305.1 TIR domain protein [Helicobacter pylori]
MKTYIIDADNIDGDLFFYNLTRNSNDFSMLPIFELDRIAQKIRNILKKHGSRKDIILNHRELQEAFFSPFKPQLKNAQVFLSHSHADRNKALEVKDYLEEYRDAECVFIDSLFWDYKDDVLNELAKYDDISRIEDAFTLILRESLEDMIKKCPYFVFLQSKNSVSNQGLSRNQDLLKITHSAWIYEELKIAHSISESRPIPMMESMQLFHDISLFLKSFETITLKKLSQQINS